MERYVEHLIQDILDIQPPVRVSSNNSDFDIELHFIEVERYINEEPERTFGEQVGLTSEQFPPSSKLTQDQLERINDAFEEMLASNGISVFLPDECPEVMRYETLLLMLPEKLFLDHQASQVFDFCDLDLLDCRYGKYCICRANGEPEEIKEYEEYLRSRLEKEKKERTD